MNTIFGAGGGGCFLGSTLIRTPSGQKRIDEIVEQDLVICFDDKGELYQAKVLAVHVHDNEKTFKYKIWGDISLDVTLNHWVLNQFNAFVCIGTLGQDDCLIDENNHLRPILSAQELGEFTVYNLTVEGYHTFIANGIRVHNAGLGNGAISGAGGRKKKGSGGTTTAQDTLNSTAYARIVDLLSEGEIEGFPSARQYARDSSAYMQAMLKDIYLDKTPIVRKDATVGSYQSSDYNFKGIDENSFALRWGTVNQSYMPGFDAAENVYSVNVVVKEQEPVVRTITDADTDRVKVTLSWPALQKMDDKGNIVGEKVEYMIQVRYSGGGYITKVETNVSGRTGDLYQRTHSISLNDAGGTFPVDIKVIRKTQDPTDPKRQTEFSWYSYTEVVDVKLAYPNSAMVGMQVDARSFDSIPLRSYKIRGIKVQFPSNATVDDATGRLIYEGVWDGTFGAAQWTSDPCWCLWDLLTNCRYGFGQNIPSRTLDKWSFYQASVYCNELVKSGRKDSSGADIYEPRFSCNVSIQSQDEAYKLINDMCSIFMAMPYWGAGTLVISQDRPTSPLYLFNQTNVSEEGFQYNGSSLKTRSTVAIVKYFDMQNQNVDYVSVEDQAAISKYGVITKEIEAFACTSISQARRVGEWLLYSQQNESETITFKTSIDGGAVVRPGMVIATSDPLRAGVRRSGRIRGGGSDYIIIDEPLSTDIPATGSPSVYVSMSDGTVENYTVASASGAKITISGTFISTPLVGGVFIYDNDQMKKETWRVINVKEDNGCEYQITGLAYNPTKYDYIERDVTLDESTYLPLEVITPADPQNISSTNVVYESNGQLSNKVLLSWESDSNAVQYNVSYRLVG